MIRLRAVLWLDTVALALAMALPAPRWLLILFALALIYTAAGAIYYTVQR